jgi:hypothetical protein
MYATPRIITDADIAGLAQATGMTALATDYTQAALDVAMEDSATLAETMTALNVLAEIGDPDSMPKATKHDGECWKKHAPCLAAKLRDTMPLVWA